MPPMSAEWPDPRPDGTARHVGGLTDSLPWPWGGVLGAVGTAQYALLAFLGAYSVQNWYPLAQGTGYGVAWLGAATAAVVALFGGACAIAKALGFWQAEWVLLWFLMSGLVVHAILEAIGSGWPEWVAAQVFFLFACIARCLSLLLFAKRARWGADRRHLIHRGATE